jgi:hypothetical protein
MNIDAGRRRKAFSFPTRVPAIVIIIAMLLSRLLHHPQNRPPLRFLYSSLALLV